MEHFKDEFRALAEQIQAQSLELKSIREEYNKIFDNLKKGNKEAEFMRWLCRAWNDQSFASFAIIDAYCDIYDGIGWPEDEVEDDDNDD